MLHSVDQSPYVSDCALQTKFLKKVQKGDHIFVHSKSRLCPSLSCFSLSVYSLSGIFCYCERIVKKRLKLWYPIYFVFYQNRGVQPFCYCRPPGPQPTDIFGGGAKWCNLLLHLTNTHVCENFGGGQLPDIPPLVAGLPAALPLFIWSTATNEFDLYLWDTAKCQPTQNTFKH